MGHSIYTSKAVGYVASNPGCCKWDLANHLTRSPQRCPSKQYYLVNTQIRLGNIVALLKGNRYELYTPEAVPEVVIEWTFGIVGESVHLYRNGKFHSENTPDQIQWMSSFDYTDGRLATILVARDRLLDLGIL